MVWFQFALKILKKLPVACVSPLCILSTVEMAVREKTKGESLAVSGVVVSIIWRGEEVRQKFLLGSTLFQDCGKRWLTDSPMLYLGESWIWHLLTATEKMLS